MLPKDSQERIEYLASQILFSVNGRITAVPKELYEWKRRYTFEERLLSGNWCPFPSMEYHGTNCFDDAAVKFFIADHLKLNPELIMVWGYKKKEKKKKKASTLDKLIERSIPENDSVTNHAINIMDYKTRRILVDTYYNRFGLVKINEDKKEFLIRESDGPWTRMQFRDKFHFNKEELIEKMTYHQTDPDGIISNIEGGHRVKKYSVQNFREDLLFNYDRDQNKVVVQIQALMPHITNMAFENHMLLDSRGELIGERVNYSAFSSADWMHLEDKLDFGTYDMELVKGYWAYLASIFDYKDSYASLKRINFFEVLTRLDNERDKSVLLEDPFYGKIRDELMSNLDDDYFRYRFIRMFIPQFLYNQRDNKYIYEAPDQYKVIKKLRNSIIKMAPEYVATMLVNAELKRKMSMPDETLDKKIVKRKLNEIGEAYDNLGHKHTRYRDVFFMGQNLFQRIRDFELFAEKNPDIITLQDEFLGSEEAFIQRYFDDMLEVFSFKLEQLMIRAYQTKGNLRFRKYFHRIRPKVKDFLAK